MVTCGQVFPCFCSEQNKNLVFLILGSLMNYFCKGKGASGRKTALLHNMNNTLPGSLKGTRMYVKDAPFFCKVR